MGGEKVWVEHVFSLRQCECNTQALIILSWILMRMKIMSNVTPMRFVSFFSPAGPTWHFHWKEIFHPWVAVLVQLSFWEAFHWMILDNSFFKQWCFCNMSPFLFCPRHKVDGGCSWWNYCNGREGRLAKVEKISLSSNSSKECSKKWYFLGIFPKSVDCIRKVEKW